jgi:hypothetical protein
LFQFTVWKIGFQVRFPAPKGVQRSIPLAQFIQLSFWKNQGF